MSTPSSRRSFLALVGALGSCAEEGATQPPSASGIPSPSGSLRIADPEPSAPPVAPARPRRPGRGRDRLIAEHPGLSFLPWMSLAECPTPIELAPSLAKALGVGELWIKRDDQSAAGNLVSGGKVRKLEWLLAEAVQLGHRSVVTFGGAGSNHAVATAAYGRELGLAVRVELAPQPKSAIVRQNLLRLASLGAEIVPIAGVNDAAEKAQRRARRERDPRRSAYVIPPGGTSPLGNMGFVEAGYELALQIEAGLLPRPDRIVMATGTTGSAAGLAIGLAAARVDTKITAVRCSSPETASADALRAQIDATLARLRARAPELSVRPAFPGLDGAQLGAGYGVPTKGALRAIELAREHMGLVLEPVYTGKALAALGASQRSTERVLFWASQPAPWRDPAVSTSAATPGRLHGEQEWNEKARIPAVMRAYLELDQ